MSKIKFQRKKNNSHCKTCFRIKTAQKSWVNQDFFQDLLIVTSLYEFSIFVSLALNLEKNLMI